jgi:hypothetical protein
MALSLAELQKAQAEVDGFQYGPAPALNPANRSTQAALGNPQAVTSPPSVYYPSNETPNFRLSTEDMSSQLANNFVAIDTLIAGSVLVIQSRMQYVNTTAPQTISLSATATQMYAVSLFTQAAGTAAGGHAVSTTISYTSALGVPETISVSTPLDSANVVMETYPLMVLGGTTITLSTAYAGGATNDPYTISARLVQMP